MSKAPPRTVGERYVTMIEVFVQFSLFIFIDGASPAAFDAEVIHFDFSRIHVLQGLRQWDCLLPLLYHPLCPDWEGASTWIMVELEKTSALYSESDNTPRFHLHPTSHYRCARNRTSVWRNATLVHQPTSTANLSPIMRCSQPRSFDNNQARLAWFAGHSVASCDRLTPESSPHPKAGWGSLQSNTASSNAALPDPSLLFPTAYQRCAYSIQYFVSFVEPLLQKREFHSSSESLANASIFLSPHTGPRGWRLRHNFPFCVPWPCETAALLWH